MRPIPASPEPKEFGNPIFVKIASAAPATGQPPPQLRHDQHLGLDAAWLVARRAQRFHEPFHVLPERSAAQDVSGLGTDEQLLHHSPPCRHMGDRPEENDPGYAESGKPRAVS